MSLPANKENTMQMKKLRGGIGALTAHLVDTLTRDGGEVRLEAYSL